MGPEMKKEIISLVNQSLRNSVIMFNETVKAFEPHFNIAKDSLFKAADVLKKEARIAYSKSSVAVQQGFEKLMKLLNELIEKIQKHEMYRKGQKIYNDAINHKN